jgi:hypothetical protein
MVASPKTELCLGSRGAESWKVGDKLVVMDFAKSITRGFAAVGEPDVAVCLLPGTELAFEDDANANVRALA